MPTVLELPDPPPQKITLRFVTYKDPGWLVVEYDGQQAMGEIYDVTEDDFREMCDQIKGLDYRPRDDWYCDMALIVQHFERNAS